MQTWMLKTWLPQRQRWVWAYRKDRFNVKLNTNNGVERQNRSFKYQFLSDNRDKTLSGIVTVLVKQFLPYAYRKYVEENLRYSSMYRKHNGCTPGWLHNRPRQFVMHCIQRIKHADSIKPEAIIRLSDKGDFSVQSQTNPSHSYNLFFGEENVMPFCTCPDWKKSHLPCKHFIAIFQYYPQWSWSGISSEYRESPFFNIDESVCCSQQHEQGTPYKPDEHIVPVSLPAFEVNSGNETHPDSEEPESSTVIFKSTAAALQSASIGRELLRQLETMTYLCSDEQALNRLRKDLQTAMLNLRPHLPSENGLFMEVKKPKKFLLVKGHQQSKVKYGSLPPRKRKHKQGGVSKAEPLNKRPYLSTAPSDQSTPSTSSISSQHSSESAASTSSTSPPWPPQSEPSTSHVSPFSCRGPVSSQGSDINSCHNYYESPFSNMNNEDAMHMDDDQQSRSKDDPIIIDEHTKDVEYLINYHDPNLDISVVLHTDSEAAILDPTFWLTDSQIQAAQQLLKCQFPHIDGLKDPAVQGELVTPAVSDFVQIINTGGHWVCLTTIGCPNGSVKVLDSLYIRPSSIAVKHACRLLVHCGETVTFHQEKVQKQTNFSDCGLFAIAFATTLCNGEDPTLQSYQEKNLRHHYIKCLKQEKMEQFPNVSRRVPRHQTMSTGSVPIYCTCRMPNDGKEYVQCGTCTGWYHPDCASIPNWVLHNNRRWRCLACKQGQQ